MDAQNILTYKNKHEITYISLLFLLHIHRYLFIYFEYSRLI